MSKKKGFTNLAFQKAPAAKVEKPAGFNLVTQSGANAFNSVFDIRSHSLNPKDETAIDKLLKENYDSETSSKDQLPKDQLMLRQVTQEIRAIANQGAYLIGERVSKTRDILKRYKQDTFGQWLEIAFNSRKTGYNFLAFYELWKNLPTDEVKNKYKSMPKGAAYMLASKQAGLQKKVTFIDKFFDLKPKLLILELRKSFPSSRRSNRNQTLVPQLKNILQKVTEEAEYLTQDELKDLKLLQKVIGRMTMKYLAISKPKSISLEKAKIADIFKLVELAEREGERAIIQCGISTAAIVPLEDLEVLESE